MWTDAQQSKRYEDGDGRPRSGHVSMWVAILIAAALLATGLLVLDGVGDDGPDIDLRIETPAEQGGGSP